MPRAQKARMSGSQDIKTSVAQCTSSHLSMHASMSLQAPVRLLSWAEGMQGSDRMLRTVHTRLPASSELPSGSKLVFVLISVAVPQTGSEIRAD